MENKEEFPLANIGGVENEIILENKPEGGIISDAGLSAFQASMNDKISGCQPECGHSTALAYLYGKLSLFCSYHKLPI